MVQGTQMWIAERDNVPYSYGVFTGDDMSFAHYTRRADILLEASQISRIQVPYQLHQPTTKPATKPTTTPSASGTSADTEDTNGGDGILFLNGTNSAGHPITLVTWYRYLTPNLTGLPDAKIQASVHLWEGSEQRVTFSDGIILTWSAPPSNAQTQADFSEMGTANNNYYSLVVFKDRKRQVFVLDEQRAQRVREVGTQEVVAEEDEEARDEQPSRSRLR
ncbi:hypothetical protein BDZ45DRAFT_722154 [Acephala macrosclerotiorum]|nr:hypothetical protein BDZ45DRAFT_722154 [Acephala macrosclerotiorum]